MPNDWTCHCSSTVGNDVEVFVGPTKKMQNGKATNGVSRAMGVTGSRKARWSLVDTAREL